MVNDSISLGNEIRYGNLPAGLVFEKGCALIGSVSRLPGITRRRGRKFWSEAKECFNRGFGTHHFEQNQPMILNFELGTSKGSEIKPYLEIKLKEGWFVKKLLARPRGQTF